MNIVVRVFYTALLLLVSVVAQPINFDPLKSSQNLCDPVVYCFAQDTTGYMWIGTRNGLNKYNGYRLTSYNHVAGDSLSLPHSRINCLYISNQNQLLIGTDRGVCRYNIDTDDFITLHVAENLSVKFIEQCGDLLWIGTNHGLYSYNEATNQSEHFSKDDKTHWFPGDYVPCACVVQNNRLLVVGTHDKLCLMGDNKVFEQISVSGADRTKSNLVLSVINDRERDNTLWIGTENGLIRYNMSARQSTYWLTGIPIKTLCYAHNGDLMLGTDNGLYIKGNGTLTFEAYKHNTDNRRSILNDVVWSVYSDKSGNIWFGTDNGISLMNRNSQFNYTSIKDITGKTDGHQVFAICRDSLGHLWLGGSNGLICNDLLRKKTEWFKTDNNGQLLHNKVRCLYDDGRNMWIASDGGLNCYNYFSGKLQSFAIRDSAQMYNSNWMYTIAEDASNRLWIGTYEGGVFVVDKQKLLTSNGRQVFADIHFSAEDAKHHLPSNIVNSIVTDGDTVWVATENMGLERITSQGSTVLNVANGAIASNNIRALAKDDDGNLWIGTDAGLYLLKRGAQKTVRIAPKKLNGQVRFVVCHGNTVWVNVNGNVAHVDIDKKTIYTIFTGESDCLSASLYAPENRLYLGITDGFIDLQTNQIETTDTPMPQFTDLLVGNEPVRVKQPIRGHVLLHSALRNEAKIEFPYSLNSFGIELSSFLFEHVGEVAYSYRLDGFDDQAWQQLPMGENIVRYNNLPPGNYKLLVSSISADGKRSGGIASLAISINPPWYMSAWAKMGYILAFLLIIVEIYVVIHKRQRLAIEDMERRKTMKLARMKLDFFANMSHEFKTPLSLIVCNVGRLMAVSQSMRQQPEIKSIQQNAQKLHALIVKMLNTEDQSADTLMTSLTTLPEFFEDLVSRFRPLFAEKQVTINLECDCGTHLFNIDRVKFDSAISNILSNALKFTPQDGCVSIKALLNTTSDEVVITVSDTGCGISATDLPHIGERYFKSKRSAGVNPTGTGIGMSMVKSIVEQHKGVLEIESSECIGTTVKIILPCATPISNNADDLPPFPVFKQKPIALIAEDNDELRSFMANAMSQHFEIVAVCDGQQAFDKAAVVKPDIIVTDIMMPITNGIALSKMLRDNINTALIPIIALTALTDSRTEMQSLEYVDAFIAKPFDIEYLEKRMANLIVKARLRAQKMRQQDIATSIKPEVLPNLDEQFLRKITQLIEESISDPELNVSELCARSGIGEKQLYRRLKQITGITAVEFIRSIRLKKAAMYLQQGQLTVSEIMYMVGFSNHSYFTKCFKKEYGVVPKEYKGGDDE